MYYIFQLIFAQRQFYSFTVEIQFSQYHLLKCLSFLLCMFLTNFVKCQMALNVWVLESSRLYSLSTYLFCTSTMPFFLLFYSYYYIIMALLCNLRQDILIHIPLDLLLRVDYLGCLGTFALPREFYGCYPNSTKNDTEILMGFW